jgi:RNA polymerase sigma-32 factor
MSASTDLTRYVSIAAQHPVLTREEELVLTRRWRESGDQKSADCLVRSHLRYVVAMALKYRHYGVATDELIAEGNAGVVQALRRFEPDSGNRFLTYATYWIRAYVLQCVLRSWSIVSGGSGALRSTKFFRLRRERRRLTNLLGDGERVAEVLAETLGTTTAQITRMVHRLDARDVSLDLATFVGSTTSLVETMAWSGADPEESVASDQANRQMSAVVHQALADLDHRERYIVDHRLMADRGHELTLAEIGHRFSVSRERVRQLEARAKGKLRIRIAEISQHAVADWLDTGSAAI